MGNCRVLETCRRCLLETTWSYPERAAHAGRWDKPMLFFQPAIKGTPWAWEPPGRRAPLAVGARYKIEQVQQGIPRYPTPEEGDFLMPASSIQQNYFQ